MYIFLQAAHYRKYAVEALFHRWLLRSRFRTRDPSGANTFFVPVYAAAALLQGNRDSVRVRDRARSLVLGALAHVRAAHPYWDRRDGRDHVWLFAAEQGACLDRRPERPRESRLAVSLLHELRHSVFLSTSGDTATPCFRASRDVVIPPMLSEDVLQESYAYPYKDP